MLLKVAQKLSIIAGSIVDSVVTWMDTWVISVGVLACTAMDFTRGLGSAIAGVHHGCWIPWQHELDHLGPHRCTQEPFRAVVWI